MSFLTVVFGMSLLKSHEEPGSSQQDTSLMTAVMIIALFAVVVGKSALHRKLKIEAGLPEPVCFVRSRLLHLPYSCSSVKCVLFTGI